MINDKILLTAVYPLPAVSQERGLIISEYACLSHAMFWLLSPREIYDITYD